MVAQTLSIVALLVACRSPSDPLVVSVALEIVDEAGQAVGGAHVTLQGDEQVSDVSGRVTLATKTTELAIVSKPGWLDEPVVISRADAKTPVRVTLWRGGERRWVMHTAGDVMFGRRFNAPPTGAPLLAPERAADGAREVVAAIQPAFSAADVRTVNLETVVSRLATTEQYPGKRFILNSPPEALAALEALGVDAIDLANNHGRDFLGAGIDATQAALAASSLPRFGESRHSDGEAPLVVHAGGVSIGLLGWTSVDGAFVNDAYPVDGDPIRSDVPPDELWQYMPRAWSYLGATWSVPRAQRRIGSAWRLFAAAESDLAPAEAADAWGSLTAVYPELQDWVQRRGHAGAALWRTADAQAQIAELARSVDLVVVQLHAGFQFQPAPSASVRMMAHAAIDAGAGIVICHHPHVVQGAEWYKGKLILYSLGNFVFDQDFSTTFPSMFLRTIWEGNKLLEARLVPLELVGYRPIATANAAAARTLRHVWEMSVMDATADRDSERAVRVFTTTPDLDTRAANLRLERHTAVITSREPQYTERTLTVGAGQTESLAAFDLVDPRLGPDLEIGRDLLGWGHFEDDYADGADAAAAHWNIDSASEKPILAGDADDGIAYMRLLRSSAHEAPVLSRPVARTTLVEHRLHVDRDGIAIPLDPPPHYTIRLRARLTGAGAASVRVDLFHFDDTDPTEDPVSTKIGRLTFSFDVLRDGGWHSVELPIESAALVADGVRVNQLMPYLQLDPPSSGKSALDIDGVEVIEWRRADAMPDRFGAYDYVRNVGAQDRTFRVTMEAP